MKPQAPPLRMPPSGEDDLPPRLNRGQRTIGMADHGALARVYAAALPDGGTAFAESAVRSFVLLLKEEI